MKMIINISAGHSINGGAVGINCSRESYLARNFVNQLCSELSQIGLKNVNCTDDLSRTQTDNLVNLLKNHKMNNGKNDYHILVHFNADKKKIANGSEVLISCKHEKDDNTYLLASDLLDVMKKFGFRKRGIKINSKLYLLNRLDNCILFEVCYITNDKDISNYLKNKDDIIKLCAESIARWCGLWQ